MALLGFEGWDADETFVGGNVMWSRLSSGLWFPSAGGQWSANFTGGTWQKLSASYGGSMIRGNFNDGTWPLFICSSNATTLIAGYRFYALFAGGATSLGCIQFLDVSTAQIGVYYNSAQKLEVRRGGNTGTVLGTGTTVLPTSTSVMIEFKVLFSATVGTWEVRINGVTEISGTAANTISSANAYGNRVAFNTGGTRLSNGSNDGSGFDDTYICDGTGSSPTNDFLGIVHAETLMPSVQTSSGFTSGGMQYPIYNNTINLAQAFGTGTMYCWPWMSKGLGSAPPAQSGVLNALILRLGAAGFTGNAKLALYDSTGSSGTQPGNLIATSNVVTSGTGNGTFANAPDITFTFASPPSLTANTNYWIAILTDSNIPLWTQNGTNINSTQAVAYASGFPSTAAVTSTNTSSTPYISSLYTGSQIVNVAEVNFDEDTSYNQATSSAVDLFSHPNMATTPTTIFGVQVNTYARKDDVANVSARTKLVSGGTTQNGTTVSTLATGNYSKLTDIYALDPNTSAAWGASAVNSTQIGYERI